MSRPKVLILTALQIEASHVAAALGLCRPGPHRPSFGTHGGLAIEIHLIGMGARDLPAIGPEWPVCTILAGFAGGLSPALRVGDVVVHSRKEEWLLPQRCVPGSIVCSDQLVASPDEKKLLFASTKAVAVDMESKAVGEWAAGAGIAWAAIRAISDRSDQSVRSEILTLVDPYGVPRVAHLSGALIRNPFLVADLWRLGRSSRVAGKNLRHALHQFIELNRDRFGGRRP